MLKQRLLTALVLVPLLLVIVLGLPREAGIGVLAAMLLLGAWEWSAFLKTGSVAARLAYVVAAGVLMAVAWELADDPAMLGALLGIALVWWFVAFLWLGLFPGHVVPWTAALAGLVVLVPAWVALGRLHLVEPDGPYWVVFLLVLVSFADVGAFFAGRRFGRVKLAPRVSPGKTWEGLGGGLVFSFLIALAGVTLFVQPAGPFIALCLGVVLISVVGDLTESLFKRYAGLKDSGTLFPGHGGVLDRIDSLMAAAPLFVLGLGWLGVVS